MASAVKYEVFSQNLAEGVHNLNTGTIKIALTNSAPNAATHTTLSDVTQISNGNGYTTGGDDAQNDTSRSGGTTTVTAVDVVWTASGSVGPFRYVVAYNDTPTSPADPLIGWWDYGSSISLASGDTLTVDLDQTNGLFTVT